LFTSGKSFWDYFRLPSNYRPGSPRYSIRCATQTFYKSNLINYWINKFAKFTYTICPALSDVCLNKEVIDIQNTEEGLK